MVMFSFKEPSCVTCYRKARKTLLQLRTKHEKVRFWAQHLRDAQVSSAQAPHKERRQRCPTCQRPLYSVTFDQWCEVTKPQVSELSD
jgi:hypothetical protein